MLAVSQESYAGRLLTLLTGARVGERAKTLYSFAALFLLLGSYYLIKPLRSSQFLKAFDYNLMPVFFLAIAMLSFSLTKVFNFCVDRIHVYRLMGYTYALIILCKLIFFVTLSHGSKAASLIFYLWAAVYFLLCNAVLWGCINSLYLSEAAERCFGFVSIGAVSGGIFGSWMSEMLASGPWKDTILLISALLMGLALACMYQAIGASEHRDPERRTAVTRSVPFWSDVQHLWQHRYVRAIATMVFALAVLNTVLEFQSLKIIDIRLSERQYLQEFSDLNRQLFVLAPTAAGPVHPEGYALVRRLKGLAAKEREQRLREFIQHRRLTLSPSLLLSAYARYEEGLEARTRELLSAIYKNQGLIGVLLLFFAARPLYRWVGLRPVLLLLPLLFGGVCVALFFPLKLLMVEWMLTTTYALNYSLYRTSKELLYTQADRETRFKLKPLIEGPVMRLGDVTASLLKLGLMALLLGGLGWSEIRLDQAYLLAALLILLYWLAEVWYVGGRYEQLRRESTLES